MTVVQLGRPVEYKGYVIRIDHVASNRYVFYVNEVVTLNLSGVAKSLNAAFDDARAMIDKLIEGREQQ